MASLAIVVGAGASNEFGLPVGQTLKQLIANALDIQFGAQGGVAHGDPLIVDALRYIAASRNSRDINPLVHVCRAIKDGMMHEESIDDYVHSHRQDEDVALCAKLAITHCILREEMSSPLCPIGNGSGIDINFTAINSTQYRDNWLRCLFGLLRGASIDEIIGRFSQIAIICFNYDRCIEHYLHAALRGKYGVDRDDASELLSHLRIYHPYGSVGSLPWQSTSDPAVFGEEFRGERLAAQSRRLRTYTEGTTAPESDVSEIREIMHSADRILFLGFAYHNLNLSLLFGEPSSEGTHGTGERDLEVFGTAKNISESNLKFIKAAISRHASVPADSLQLNNLKAWEMFDAHSRALSVS